MCSACHMCFRQMQYEDFFISGDADHWKVELDVKDFGGLQDTALRGHVETLLVG